QSVLCGYHADPLRSAGARPLCGHCRDPLLDRPRPDARRTPAVERRERERFSKNSCGRRLFQDGGGRSAPVPPVFQMHLPRLTVLIPATSAAAVPAARAELTTEQLAKLPPPATARVDFARDIQPIFEASCVQCHARGKSKGGFSLETREAFLKGG